MLKKAEVIERMKQGAILRHVLGMRSESWWLDGITEQVNGNAGKSIIKMQEVEHLDYTVARGESTYAWKREETTQEALEAQRAQVANDSAGKEAYEEAKAEAAEPEGYMRPCEHCGGSGAELGFGNHLVYCSDCDGTGIHQESEDETAQLRQQIAQLESEKVALVAEKAALKEMIERATAKNDWLSPLQAMALLGALKREFDTLPKQPAPSQAASEVPAALDKPKKPVATRMRVNWGRGFSSGSYPVLGFSREKQYYVLDISTDCNRAMPKPVRFADCLEV